MIIHDAVNDTYQSVEEDGDSVPLDLRAQLRRDDRPRESHSLVLWMLAVGLLLVGAVAAARILWARRRRSPRSP